MQQGGVRAERYRSRSCREPLLVGRNATKLEASRRNAADCRGPPMSMPRWPIRSTPSTSMRRRRTGAPRRSARPSRRARISTARSRPPTSFDDALELYRLAKHAGVKHGVVQDKLWLPGLLKLKTLRTSASSASLSRARRVRLLGFRRRHRAGAAPVLELPQRRRRRHHHRHALPLALCARQSLRRSECCVLSGRYAHSRHAGTKQGKPYACTADDSAYATFELEGGIIAHFNSSWCVRVRRDDLLTIQVDGTKGRLSPVCAIAGFSPTARRPGRSGTPISKPVELLRWLAEGAGAGPRSIMPSSCNGSCSCGTSSRRAIPVGSARRRQRRAAGGEGYRVVAEALLGRCSGSVVSDRHRFSRKVTRLCGYPRLGQRYEEKRL